MEQSQTTTNKIKHALRKPSVGHSFYAAHLKYVTGLLRCSICINFS